VACPRCQHENPPRAKFCVECGAGLATRCAACGADLPPAAKFCPECAQPIGGAPSRFTSPAGYTPRHLAERILTLDPSREGERKQVTVLFADTKGSMELLADRDPEEARRLLDPVIERMMEAVHRYEGTVNQVMGDGIMALFGAPIAHEDHAARACYAALRIQDAIRRYTEEVRRSDGVEIQVRVGLNSGDVVVRSIGSDLRMDYTAVGQTTHLAARMEQLATPGTIRLTGETVRLAEGYVTVRPLGPVPVKGLGEPVEVFELTGAGAARTRLQAAVVRGLTRFVGREAELTELRKAAELARRGRGQLVAVVGEPGVGKSRLFHEFLASHHAHGWLVLESGSVSYGKATPFLPLTGLLRAYFRIEPRDDVRTIRSRVTGTLLTLDEGLKDSIAPVIWLLEALPEDDPLMTMDPGSRRQRTLDAVKRVLLRESRVQPLLLVFEDLHWVDAETQAVLDSLVESLPTAAVLLAVNYRPEYRHDWGGRTYYRQILVDPLPPEGADDLLAGLLGDDPSVGPLKRLLIERTEGNPLFLEESVRGLADAGALAGARGAYRLVRSLASIGVPPTVQAILAARIDRLPAEDKRLLQAASVVGKDVRFALLHAIAGLPDGDLRDALGRLGAAELVYEARLFPELEYTFKHALTHEVAYASVLQERRRALHAAIVEAMERLHADRLGEHVEVLAHHALRGGLREKAARHLRQAGTRALARAAHRDAVTYFEQALDLFAELPQTPEILSEVLETRMALGPALIAIRGTSAPEVEVCYRAARDLVERLGNQTALFPTLWGLWFIDYSRGRYPVARQVAQDLLAVAGRDLDTTRVLEAHHAAWATLSAMGQPAAALPHIERGIALYERERHAGQAFVYGGHDPGTCSRYHLAATRWLLGEPDAAVRALREAFALADELGHAFSTLITCWFATWLHYQRGDREATLAVAERLVTLAGAHQIATYSDPGLLVPHLLSPDPRLGPAELREALALLRGSQARWRHTFCACLVAELAMRLEQLDVAEEALATIREDERQAFYGSEVHRLAGEIALHRSPAARDVAEAAFRRAVDVARQQSATSLELRAATCLAQRLVQDGKRGEGRALVADLYGRFTEGFDTRDLTAARTLLNELRS
jgi:class 3 adenylate cyclase